MKIQLVVFLLLCITVQTTRALENEIWISPNGPTNTTASGTPSDPFRCPSPSSLDTVLTTVLTNNYLTIHLMGGTFYVSTNGINPRTGWKLRGAGIDNTILRLYPTAFAINPGKFDVVGGVEKGIAANGVEISDVTVDCNFQNVSGVYNVEAVGLAGNDTRISRVKAINWGTVGSGSECFPLVLSWAAPGLDVTNCVIEDCIVTQPAPVTFQCGVSAILMNSDSVGYGRTNYIHGGVVRNNLVINVQSGSGVGQPQYFHAYTAIGTVSHNQAINLTGGSVGVYRDSWNGRDVLIDDNVIDNVSACISLDMESYNLSDLVIQNNVLRPAEGGCGIAYSAGDANNPNTNAFVNNFIINNNVIYPSSTATNVTALSLNGRISVSVMNNVIQGGGTGGDIFVHWSNDPLNSTALQVNTWSGNVNMAGTQIVEQDGAWQPGNKDTIKFVPTTAGWYRVMESAGALAADVKLQSGFWNNYTTDTEFWFRVYAYTSNTNSMGELGITRRGSYYYPYSNQIPTARIVNDADISGSGVYLDIYVAAGTTNVVQVTATGPYRGRLLTPPQLISTTPGVYHQINF